MSGEGRERYCEIGQVRGPARVRTVSGAGASGKLFIRHCSTVTCHRRY